MSRFYCTLCGAVMDASDLDDAIEAVDQHNDALHRDELPEPAAVRELADAA